MITGETLTLITNVSRVESNEISMFCQAVLIAKYSPHGRVHQTVDGIAWGGVVSFSAKYDKKLTLKPVKTTAPFKPGAYIWVGDSGEYLRIFRDDEERYVQIEQVEEVPCAEHLNRIFKKWEVSE